MRAFVFAVRPFRFARCCVQDPIHCAMVLQAVAVKGEGLRNPLSRYVHGEGSGGIPSEKSSKGGDVSAGAEAEVHEIQGSAGAC